MSKHSKKKPQESTLSKPLAGARIADRTVVSIRYGSKARVTRDVVFADGSQQRVSKLVLQDLVLMRKGYLPKYSGKTPEQLQPTPNK